MEGLFSKGLMAIVIFLLMLTNAGLQEIEQSMSLLQNTIHKIS
jgi:hypothetical protein